MAWLTLRLRGMNVQHEYSVNKGTKHRIIYPVLLQGPSVTFITQCFFWVFQGVVENRLLYIVCDSHILSFDNTALCSQSTPSLMYLFCVVLNGVQLRKGVCICDTEVKLKIFDTFSVSFYLYSNFHTNSVTWRAYRIKAIKITPFLTHSSQHHLHLHPHVHAKQ